MGGQETRRCRFSAELTSRYLRARNWVQICLMGEVARESLAELVALLTRLCAAPAVQERTVSGIAFNGALQGPSAPAVSSSGLIRISHQVSTAAADPGMSTALRSVGFLDVLSSTPAESSHRAPCIHARLRRLATKPGEKCGLTTAAPCIEKKPSEHSRN